MAYGFRSEGRSGGGYGGGRQGGFRKPFNSPRAPVREGEEVDVLIESVGEKGDGIAKIKGFVIFVPNTKANESVRIRIKKVLDKVGFGEVVGRDVEAKVVSGPKKSKSSSEVSDLKSDEPKASEDKLSKELENEDEVEEEQDDEEF